MDNNRDKHPVDEIIEKLSKNMYIPKEHRILIYEAINEAYEIGYDIAYDEGFDEGYKHRIEIEK